MQEPQRLCVSVKHINTYTQLEDSTLMRDLEALETEQSLPGAMQGGKNWLLLFNADNKVLEIDGGNWWFHW